jgi:Tfp pilus assembly protein PilO
MKTGARELIFLTVMLALLGSAYFLVFSKANQKRIALQKEILQKQAALANLQQATVGIEDLDHKITEVQQAIRFFESKLPQQKDIEAVLQEVWQMAEANALQQRMVKPLPIETFSSYSEQPIQMTFSGDFNGFYSFLLQLEKLPRITRITQMKLEKINDHDGQMQAQITLSIFFDPGNVPAPMVKAD